MARSAVSNNTNRYHRRPLQLRVALVVATAAAAAAAVKPNFVILFVDDLGFNEVRVPHAPFGYGGYDGQVDTPHVAALAEEGMLFMNWYSGWHVCSPSRAAMLTGRLPPRTGIPSVGGGVFAADAKGGLDPANETSFATLLRARGYASACVGKWHLGQRAKYLPTAGHGFDEYLGIPFSADMGTSYWWGEASKQPFEPTPLPLLNGTTIVQQPAGLHTLTQRYVDAATSFISRQAAAAKPFVLYLPFNHVHNPQFCSQAWCNSSSAVSPAGAAVRNPDAAAHGAGIGSSVQEMDAAVGLVMAALKASGVDEETLVWFTSDNGAPSNHDAAQRSNAPLSGFKGSNGEGGIRMPAIARWPGHVPAGSVSHALASTTDIFATMLALAGDAPAGAGPTTPRVVDGLDMSGVLLRNETALHACTYHYKTGDHLEAVRCGHFKLWFNARGQPTRLFNLTADVGEQAPVDAKSALYAAQAASIGAARAAFLATVMPVADELAKGTDPQLALCGWPDSQARFPDSPNCTSDPSLWFPFGRPAPTPPAPPAPGAPQGCWWDKGFPGHPSAAPCDLPVVKRGGCPKGGARVGGSTPMTLQLCNALCTGHAFFGVQNGGTGCFCGARFGSYGRSENCTMPCAGNETQICGGPGANSIFAVDNATMNPYLY